MRKNDLDANTQKLQSYIASQNISLTFLDDTMVREYLPLFTNHFDGIIRSVFESKLDFGFGETNVIFPRMVGDVLLVDLNYYKFFEIYAKLYELYRQGRTSWFVRGMIGLTMLFLSCVFRDRIWFSDVLLYEFYDMHLPVLSHGAPKARNDPSAISISANIMLIMYHELGHLIQKKGSDVAKSKLINDILAWQLERVFNPSEMERIKKNAAESNDNAPHLYRVLMNAKPQDITEKLREELWCDILAYTWIYMSNTGIDSDSYTSMLEGMIISNYFLDYMNRQYQAVKAVLDGKAAVIDLEKENIRFDLLGCLRDSAFIYTGDMIRSRPDHRDCLGVALSRTGEFGYAVQHTYRQAGDPIFSARDRIKDFARPNADEAQILKARISDRQQTAFQRFYHSL